MLQLKEIYNVVPCTIEFDVYVPFKIKFGEWDIQKEGTTYWRTGDFKKSLLQIGIGEMSGELRTVTLTIAKDINVVDEQKATCEERKSGNPVFAVIGEIENNKYDFLANFIVVIGKDFVSVEIGNEQKASRVISNGRVEIGIKDDDSISSLSISNLTESELSSLKKALLI